MEQLLTVRDVAKRLQINISTVYMWETQGKLPSVVLSQSGKRRCVRFRRDQIEDWIADREKAARVDAGPPR